MRLSQLGLICSIACGLNLIPIVLPNTSLTKPLLFPAIAQTKADQKAEADQLLQQGIQQFQISQFREALQSWEQALVIYREISDRLGEAQSLNNLGLAYRALGQYQQAIEFYQQSLEIKRAIGDRLGEAQSLNNLGSAYSSLGQYQQAIEFHLQSLEIDRAIGDRQGEGQSLSNIGSAYEGLGQYQQAVESYEQSLAIAREIGSLRDEAITLNDLIRNYLAKGEYQQAFELAKQLLEKNYAIGDEQKQASVLNNLGNCYSTVGQHHQAIRLYKQSLDIFRKYGDRQGAATTLNNLGKAYFALENGQRAIEFYQESLQIFYEINNIQEQSRVLNNLGNIHFYLKNNHQAIEFYKQSLAIKQELGDRYGEAATLNNLGEVYRNLKDYQQAIEFYRNSLSIVREIGDREGERIVLSNIGTLLKDQNQPELAIIFLKQSVNVTETIREGSQELSKDLQKSYTNSIADSYRYLANLLLQQDRVLEAQRVLDLLKVQELDDYLQTVRGSNDSRSGIEVLRPEQAILSQYNELQKTAIQLGQELAQLQQLSRDGQPLTPEQEQRKTKLVELQEDLKGQFRDFADSDTVKQLVQQLSYDAQRQSLDLQSLTKLQDTLQSLNAAIFYPLILDDRLELVITVPGSPPLRRTVQGVGREQLNTAILDFRQDLQDPNQDAKPAAQQLYEWLIAPIEDDLKNANVQTIIYAPDGQLRYIPLAALYDGNQWLVQRYQINNITAESLTDWTETPEQQPRLLAAAFADDRIIYPGNLRGLPFAGQEVTILSQTIPNVRSFLDQAFSLEALKPIMNEYNIIHFATHAAFVTDNPDNSFILFGNNDRPTLRDIANWTLNQVDLVVLSACETGLGGLGNGEEVLGLGYQFQQAGAKATIASLWQVNDGGTQILMNAFYTALGQGMTKTEALQRAQQALITGDMTAVGAPRGSATVDVISRNTGLPANISNNLDHPYYWAPFILIGNGL